MLRHCGCPARRVVTGGSNSGTRTLCQICSKVTAAVCRTVYCQAFTRSSSDSNPWLLDLDRWRILEATTLNLERTWQGLKIRFESFPALIHQPLALTSARPAPGAWYKTSLFCFISRLFFNVRSFCVLRNWGQLMENSLCCHWTKRLESSPAWTRTYVQDSEQKGAPGAFLVPLRFLNCRQSVTRITWFRAGITTPVEQKSGIINSKSNLCVSPQVFFSDKTFFFFS